MNPSAPAPMKRRRQAMPGMPAADEREDAHEALKEALIEPTLLSSESPAPDEKPREAAPASSPGPERERPRRRNRRPVHRQSAVGLEEQADAGVAENPYSGAGTTSLNVRVLVPLHVRYRKLVRDLEEEGYRASATELFQALLHFGPAGTDEARDLLRRWRTLLDADPPRRA